jgi:hypothetical protein
MQQLYIQFINYVWYLLHVSALHYRTQETLPENGNVMPKHVGDVIYD